MIEEFAMLHGYINQRTFSNKGQIQFKAITFCMADCGPNFGVPQRGCVCILCQTLCVCVQIHALFYLHCQFRIMHRCNLANNTRGAKLTMSVWNFNLQRVQVRKRGED